MKSPLLIGTDLSKLSAHDLGVLNNPYLLAFNQDPTYGRPAEPYKWGTNPDWTFDAKRPAEYWAGASERGVLVLVLNTDDAAVSRAVAFDEVPGLSGGMRFKVTDVWTGDILEDVELGLVAEIGPHDTAVVLVEVEE
jgi:alpha-galactosidase